MSNHPPPPNHSRPSLSGPNHAATKRSLPLTPALILLLLLPPAAAAQNAAGAAEPDPPPDTYPYGQQFNPSMAIIMVVLVSAFFLLGFVSVYIRQCAESRFRGPSTDQPEVPHLFGRGAAAAAARGIDASVIESFPTFHYSSVKRLKIGKGSLECAVCLNEFEDDDVLRLLPRCNHVFHTECVDAWLSSHTTCPVCRANLVPKPGEKFDPAALQVAEPEPSLQPSGPPDHQVRVPVADQGHLKPDSQLSKGEESPSTNRSRPPRSRSTGMRFTRLFSFPRSNSTGHSLILPGDDRERFTLRLPEDVRDHIIKSGSLHRAKSCATALPRARSARTGYRRSGSNGGGRSIREKNYFDYERFDDEDRTGWWGFSMTPPFIGRTGSVQSGRGAADDEVSMTPPRSMSRPERSPPFGRLFIGVAGDGGERSSDCLRPPDSLV